tara:strand:- start:1540 stop:3063 length:1524 start_codon:yes stop_codon:yes gene_type:complete
MNQCYDVLVVGGGINGVAVARDAAGRGARTLLVEQDDLGAHTSSASTKLIHGGLRYLEQYEFRLVAKALAERERLMRAAPHLIRPLQFVLPHDRTMRPAWMMRVGLFLYDRIGGNSSLPSSQAVNLQGNAFGAPLAPHVRRAFTYSDCWGDDSRLVIANARDAADHGAEIMPRTRCLSAKQGQVGWTVTIQSEEGASEIVQAKVLVNATGSWAADFLPQRAGIETTSALRLIKGSHIVTRRLFDGDHAYILQNPDKRIIFAIPYEDDFTLIGTTDVDWQGDPSKVEIGPEEVEYLCQSFNRWFASKIGPQDVIWSYAGLRPLYDDATSSASEISRDYVLSLDGGDGLAPVLTIYGGKITTHRALAEEVMNTLGGILPSLADGWTREAPMPGGDLGEGGLPGLIDELGRKASFLDPATRRRLAQSYGSKVWSILNGAQSLADLGEVFGAGFTEAEAEYLIGHEWARSAEDILWRRSKLGLHLDAAATARFEVWLRERLANSAERAISR